MSNIIEFVDKDTKHYDEMSEHIQSLGEYICNSVLPSSWSERECIATLAVAFARLVDPEGKDPLTTIKAAAAWQKLIA